MITVDSFFSGTLSTVDAVIANFVNAAYLNFVQANAGLITLLFTVYVMLLGYQFINHKHHFNLSTVMRHIVLMLTVYGMVMSWRLYHLFVYNIFTNEPANIANILVSASGQFTSNASIVQALDGIYASVMHAAGGFLGEANFSAAGVAFLFYAFLIFCIGTAMCVFALLVFVYAKMMMAILLALGPIFILFILWEPSKGLFSAWLQNLITIALIPIITSAILVLMLSVMNVTLPAVNQPTESQQFYGIAPFLGLSLATTLLLSQVFKISSSLGSGISLASLSAGTPIVISALQKTGIAAAGRAAMGLAKNKSRQITR